MRAWDVHAGEEEALVVPGDRLRQPVGARVRADREKQLVGLNRLLVPGRSVAQHEVGQPAVATAADDLGLRA